MFHVQTQKPGVLRNDVTEKRKNPERQTGDYG